MTEQTQPTDAELEACPFCGNANAIVYDDLLTFHAGCLSCGATGSVSSYRNGAIAAWNRRAVLAKLGTPAGAGEVAYLHDDGYWTPAKTEAGRHLNDRLMCAGSPKVAVYLTPQPTQAQAGAVPLTRYRVLEPRVDRIEADDEYLQDDAQTWATDPNGTFVGTIYGYALRAARRRIKGADHD